MSDCTWICKRKKLIRARDLQRDKCTLPDVRCNLCLTFSSPCLPALACSVPCICGLGRAQSKLKLVFVFNPATQCPGTCLYDPTKHSYRQITLRLTNSSVQHHHPLLKAQIARVNPPMVEFFPELGQVSFLETEPGTVPSSGWNLALPSSLDMDPPSDAHVLHHYWPEWKTA